MTWTFSFASPMSSRNIIRTLVHDDDVAEPLLADEQIDAITSVVVGDISKPFNVYKVAALVADRIAGDFGRRGHLVAGDITSNNDQRAKDYRSLAAALRSQSRLMGVTPYAGGISVADMQAAASNTDRPVQEFAVGMLTFPGVVEGATRQASGVTVIERIV